MATYIFTIPANSSLLLVRGLAIANTNDMGDVS